MATYRKVVKIGSFEYTYRVNSDMDNGLQRLIGSARDVL